MSGVWKRLIVPVAAVFIVTASWQVSPAVAAAGQAGMAVKAPKAGAAARARVNVKATSTEVANEVVRLFTERGYRLAKQKGNRLVFQQPANVTLVQLAQGSGLGGAAVARVVVTLKEKKKGRTRVSAHMLLLAGSGEGRKQKVRVTAGEVALDLKAALDLVKASAEAA